MKSQTTIKSLLIILLAAASITACKKDEPVDQPTDSSSVQQLSKDDGDVGGTVDEAMFDAGIVLAGTDMMKNFDLPCNCTLDSMWTYQDTLRYRLRYQGMNCLQNRIRNGHITLKIRQNTQWHMPGAFVAIEFDDYVVTNVYNGATMRINGVASIENVSGGTPGLLGNGPNTIIHRNSVHAQISFNGNPPREWQLRKRLVFSGTHGDLVIAVNGYGNVQGYNNLLSWGKDRNGRTFFTQINETMIHKQRCDFLPSAGEEVFIIPEENLEATATFGFNNSNQPIMGNECPMRFRLHWRQHGKSGNIFLPLRGNN
ncbi:MAG TPA: hypothetical protein VK994_04290 [Bacteroidales bacterium]|nr:hypothetical protein [Bacteroidales bacterium]